MGVQRLLLALKQQQAQPHSKYPKRRYRLPDEDLVDLLDT